MRSSQDRGRRPARAMVTMALAWALALAPAWAPGAGVALAQRPAAPDAAAKGPGGPPGPARTATWEELVPPDWDPFARFRGRDLATIREGSADEQELMRVMREAWDKAPTRSDLDGARIRLPGYVVPLDAVDGGRLTQFLLVPYFGACIHSPPPPANQIVHVRLKTPATWRSMDAVWVSGTLATTRQDSALGVSAYAMTADSVQAYRAERR